MEAYAKTIFDFCNRIKDTDLNAVIDIGNQYNNSKIKFILKKILGISTGDLRFQSLPMRLYQNLKFLLKNLTK